MNPEKENTTDIAAAFEAAAGLQRLPDAAASTGPIIPIVHFNALTKKGVHVSWIGYQAQPDPANAAQRASRKPSYYLCIINNSLGQGKTVSVNAFDVGLQSDDNGPRRITVLHAANFSLTNKGARVFDDPTGSNSYVLEEDSYDENQDTCTNPYTLSFNSRCCILLTAWDGAILMAPEPYDGSPPPPYSGGGQDSAP